MNLDILHRPAGGQRIRPDLPMRWLGAALRSAMELSVSMISPLGA